MRTSITTKGDWSNTMAFLKRARKGTPTSSMHKAGRAGVSSLRSATPRRSGATANGWLYKIERSGSSLDLSFYNNAHPDRPVNVALLINYGHGTGTGGYVPAVPFIKPAIDSILKGAADDAIREMIK